MRSFFLAFAVVGVLVGCTHNPPVEEETSSASDAQIAAVPAAPVNQAADLNDNESDMQNLPQTMNEKVNKWIEYFQGNGRPNMKKYLERSARYLPEMKKILRQHGLPEDLVFIALIESGFKSRAISRARAVGYWQFIGSTGRRYGLAQNYYVDERRDYIASTEAAAKYLKALYNLFGSWYLAIASYNVGENRIKNLVMKHYTRDFWQLARDKRLPRETENYVPKFLAARLIAKHPEKYGFNDVVYEPPLDFKEVTFEKGVDMKAFARQVGLPLKELRRLNPAYKRDLIPRRDKGSVIRVPKSFEDGLVLAALQKSVSKVKMPVIGQMQIYRIRSGDTLSHLARRFGTSIGALRRANGWGRRSMLYPGQKIKIPAGRKSTSRSVAKVKARAGEKVYRVRSGDSLYSISKKFGVSVSTLKKRNRLGGRSLIRAGKTLVIPGKGAAKVRRRVHIVRSGETLAAIAQRYRIKLSALTAANALGRSTRILVGRRLVIP